MILYNQVKKIGIEQEGKRDVDIRTCHICVDSVVYMLENHAEDTARIIKVVSHIRDMYMYCAYILCNKSRIIGASCSYRTDASLHSCSIINL